MIYGVVKAKGRRKRRTRREGKPMRWGLQSEKSADSGGRSQKIRVVKKGLGRIDGQRPRAVLGRLIIRGLKNKWQSESSVPR